MKAALYTKPHSLKLATRDLRKIGPDEVLVRVEVCGICGTDLHIVEGLARSTPPVILGHEYVGVIEEIGKGVKRFKIGERVAVDPNISCGHCFHCRKGEVNLCANLKALGVDIDGGMAEFSIVPEPQLYKIPDSLPPEAAVFIEPVSCVVHGVDRAGVQPGASIVIIGAGTVGLLMLQMAKYAGASKIVIIEPNSEKQRISTTLGADFVVSPRNAVSEINDILPAGADVVIECVGKPETMKQAISLARRGGTVEFFGVCPIGDTISVEPNEIYFKELTIVGSYVNPKTFSRAIEALASGAVRPDMMPVAKFPLDELDAAFSALREGRTIKSILQPGL